MRKISVVLLFCFIMASLSVTAYADSDNTLFLSSEDTPETIASLPEIIQQGNTVYHSRQPETPPEIPQTTIEVVRTVKTTNGDVSVTVTSYPDMAGEVFTLMNQERASSGLPPLSWDNNLSEACLQRAVESTVVWSHTRPDGSQWNSVDYRINGENLAMGQKTAQEVMTDWMESFQHRNNILRKSYTKVSVVCVKTDTDFYWIQLFRI